MLREKKKSCTMLYSFLCVLEGKGLCHITLAKESTILLVQKCGRKKLYPKGKLPLRREKLQLRDDFS